MEEPRLNLVLHQEILHDCTLEEVPPIFLRMLSTKYHIYLLSTPAPGGPHPLHRHSRSSSSSTVSLPMLNPTATAPQNSAVLTLLHASLKMTPLSLAAPAASSEVLTWLPGMHGRLCFTNAGVHSFNTVLVDCDPNRWEPDMRRNMLWTLTLREQLVHDLLAMAERLLSKSILMQVKVHHPVLGGRAHRRTLSHSQEMLDIRPLIQELHLGQQTQSQTAMLPSVLNATLSSSPTSPSSSSPKRKPSKLPSLNPPASPTLELTERNLQSWHSLLQGVSPMSPASDAMIGAWVQHHVTRAFLNYPDDPCELPKLS